MINVANYAASKFWSPDMEANIEARYAALADQDEDFIVHPSVVSIGRAARILRSIQREGGVPNYAIGRDGSIGIYAVTRSGKMYVDILNSRMLRYYRTVGLDEIQRVVSADASEDFLNEIAPVSFLDRSTAGEAFVALWTGDVPRPQIVGYSTELHVHSELALVG